MDEFEKLKKFFQDINEQTNEQMTYNENPDKFSREKRQELKGIPQDDVDSILNPLRDQKRAFDTAEGMALGATAPLNVLGRASVPAIQALGKTKLGGAIERLLQDYRDIPLYGEVSEKLRIPLKAGQNIAQGAAHEAEKAQRAKELFNQAGKEKLDVWQRMNSPEIMKATDEFASARRMQSNKDLADLADLAKREKELALLREAAKKQEAELMSRRSGDLLNPTEPTGLIDPSLDITKQIDELLGIKKVGGK